MYMASRTGARAVEGHNKCGCDGLRERKRSPVHLNSVKRLTNTKIAGVRQAP